MVVTRRVAKELLTRQQVGILSILLLALAALSSSQVLLVLMVIRCHDKELTYPKMALPAIILAEGSTLGHGQTTSVFDDSRPTYFYPFGHPMFGLGFRTPGDYFFIGKTLRPFKLLPFTWEGTYCSLPFLPVLSPVPVVARSMYQEWYQRERAIGLQLRRPIGSRIYNYFLHYLAEKYPDYDGATDGSEVVIFPSALYDIGLDFTAEEKSAILFRYPVFTWDDHVNPAR
jgi:hypothetical protein